MLFPELGPQYYNEPHRDILSRMEAFYAESITINQSFWGEADTDTRFYVGDQTLWNDLYGNLPANRRRQFTFNRIMRVTNMITGHQRRNRKSTVCVGVENFDNDTADQFTKILMWINQNEGVYETISEAFLDGSIVTGMNLLQVWMDYREDPVNGNIKVSKRSYNAFLIDPYFRKPDLSDCNSIWTRSFLTKRECVSLFPDKTDEIMALHGNDSGTGRDGKFQFMPESYNYGYKNLLTYDEFYYRDYRTQKMLVDSQTGETMEWRSDDDERLSAFLKRYPTVTVVKQEIPTVRLAVVIQGKVMYDGPQPSGIDVYPFVPVLGYYNPQSPYFPWRIQGVVRGLRDAQYLYNRRRVIELDILESQINSGWIYKENALVNPKDIFLSGQGKGLALKDEAQMTDVVKIPSAGIDASVTNLTEALGREINEIPGISEELLGFDNKDTLSGVHSMLKQGAGLTTLQILFDNLDFAQKQLGKIMLDLIQTNWTPGKVKKILEGQEPSPQFYNKAFGKYGCAVEEGLNTTTQKQMNFAQLLQLREAGVNIPDDELLDASTIQNKTKLMQKIQQAQQQQAQMQQQQSELQMAQLQSQIRVADSTAAANQGLYLERASRVEENIAMAHKQVSEAHKEDELALLNLVKSLKEIDDLDLAHIEKLINLANVIKNVDAQKEAQQLTQNNNTQSNGSVGRS